MSFFDKHVISASFEDEDTKPVPVTDESNDNIDDSQPESKPVDADNADSSTATDETSAAPVEEEIKKPVEIEPEAVSVPVKTPEESSDEVSPSELALDMEDVGALENYGLESFMDWFRLAETNAVVKLKDLSALKAQIASKSYNGELTFKPQGVKGLHYEGELTPKAVKEGLKRAIRITKFFVDPSRRNAVIAVIEQEISAYIKKMKESGFLNRAAYMESAGDQAILKMNQKLKELILEKVSDIFLDNEETYNISSGKYITFGVDDERILRIHTYSDGQTIYTNTTSIAGVLYTRASSYMKTPKIESVTYSKNDIKEISELMVELAQASALNKDKLYPTFKELDQFFKMINSEHNENKGFFKRLFSGVHNNTDDINTLTMWFYQAFRTIMKVNVVILDHSIDFLESYIKAANKAGTGNEAFSVDDIASLESLREAVMTSGSMPSVSSNIDKLAVDNLKLSYGLESFGLMDDFRIDTDKDRDHFSNMITVAVNKARGYSEAFGNEDSDKPGWLVRGIEMLKALLKRTQSALSKLYEWIKQKAIKLKDKIKELFGFKSNEVIESVSFEEWAWEPNLFSYKTGKFNTRSYWDFSSSLSSYMAQLNKLAVNSNEAFIKLAESDLSAIVQALNSDSYTEGFELTNVATYKEISRSNVENKANRKQIKGVFYTSDLMNDGEAELNKVFNDSEKLYKDISKTTAYLNKVIELIETTSSKATTQDETDYLLISKKDLIIFIKVSIMNLMSVGNILPEFIRTTEIIISKIISETKKETPSNESYDGDQLITRHLNISDPIASLEAFNYNLEQALAKA